MTSIIFAVVLFFSLLLISMGTVKKVNIRELNFKNQIAKRRYVSDYINCAPTRWCDKTFKLSRIYKVLPVSDSITYFMITLGVVVVSSILCFVFTGRLFLAAFIGAGIYIFSYGILFVLRNHNNRLINKDMVLFLNLLSNYSTANTDLMSVLTLSAGKLNPLFKSLVMECVAEASIDGVDNALENMCRKTESQKFNEIIRNIRIAYKYTNSYSEYTANARMNIGNYVTNKKKLKNCVMQNTILMVVCNIALVLCMIFTGKIIEINIWNVLWSTNLGLVAVAVWVLSVLYFAKEMLEVGI